MGRWDFQVYNEATGFMIASESLHGGDYAGVDSGDPTWEEAVEEGVFLPIGLVQDDPFTIRIVLDEPLSAREEAEWVGRFRSKLRVPDGRLALIGGGPEYLWGEDMEEFTRFLDVPPGDYTAEVYTYLHSVNGDACLEAADPDEPLGAYFRRTRPGTPFPHWLHNRCADEPELDPGHEDEWMAEDPDYEAEQPLYVEFLLRLSPPGGPFELPEREEGWFLEDLGPRKPSVCPVGIVADHLVPDDGEDEGEE